MERTFSIAQKGYTARTLENTISGRLSVTVRKRKGYRIHEGIHLLELYFITDRETDTILRSALFKLEYGSLEGLWKENGSVLYPA